ncbi:hypothetical protein ABFS82_04G012800 [Erythranthe guttata]|uniref:Uncharacterized protein n=1 Tax=Erythranthe guttata TaxID=4155 RepID=A0A022S5R9_ERYGU|nr:PREDICTED: exopolygalacturonase-like [Erythranthe guttata]EYU46750.1 hypothetical protein MIMGU_mgv1a007104mg [Erythranthe guttata]|eukprot:XP_012833773.1 PREDICTED: exopolygalacturonase-like [Erythranthe guttata]
MMANTIRESRVVVITKACLAISVACMLMINDSVECSSPVLSRRSLAGEVETVFNVMDYGAKADDDTTDNAPAFIKAWRAACDSNGAGKVLIPAGNNFFSGEIVFAGPCAGQQAITIEIQGNMSALPDPSVYSGGAWIMVERAENIEVTGSGTINAHGEAAWQYADDNNHLAVSLVFQGVGNCKLNNLNFVNSMGFHTKVTDSHDVTVTNLTITAPGKSPNTDGIHLSNATNVNITDSVIGTGDDCISIGPGSKNVVVSRITCGPGHGISIGSLGKRVDETDVQGITVSNCTLIGTTNGARIKTYHDSPELTASKITFVDLVMDQVKNPIIIDQHYDSKKKPKQSSVKISDTHFINIKGSTVSEIPIVLNCSSLVPCEGIELSDIDLVPFGTLRNLTSACSNAQTTLKGTLNPAGPTQCI